MTAEESRHAAHRRRRRRRAFFGDKLERGRLSRFALLGCIVVAPLALGGAHLVVQTVLAAVIVLALALFVSDPQHGHTVRVNAAVAAVAVALLFTCVMMVPLPMAWLEKLAPGAHAAWALQQGADGWGTLSLDPAATAQEIVKLVAYMAAALLAAAGFGASRHNRMVWRSITVAGAAVVGLGVLHFLTDLHRPYGLFGYNAPWFTASFINPNHLAGFCGFAALVTLGLALHVRPALKALHVGIGVACGTAVFLSMSRGGIVCLTAALLFFIVSLWLARHTPARGGLGVQLGVAGIFLMSGALAYVPLVHELFTIEGANALDKPRLWLQAPAMLREFPWLGIGRGAFAAVFPRYHQGPVTLTFTHVENEWLQTVIDFGIVPAALLFGLVGFAVVRLLRRAQEEPPALGALAALVFVAAHNLSDFNLELMAVGLPVVVILASGDAVGRVHATLVRLRAGRLACAGLALLLMVAAVTARQHTLWRDTQRLTSLLQTDTRAREERLAEVNGVMRWHPADYLLPLMMAQEAMQADDPVAAMPWINRSMFLAPNYAPSHQWAGRALYTLGANSQGLLEMRLACQLAPASTQNIAADVWQRTGDFHQVAALAPTGMPEVQAGIAQYLLAHGAATEALTAIGDDAETDAVMLQLAATTYFTLKDYAAASRLAHMGVSKWPQHAEFYVVAAAAERAQGDVAAALATLQRGMEKSGTLEALAVHAVNLLVESDRLDEAKAIARELLERSGAAPEAHRLLGLIAERGGHHTDALREYVRARDESPENLATRTTLAGLREAAGDLRGAIRELEAAKAYGTNDGLEATLVRLRRRAEDEGDALRRQGLIESQEGVLP